ncbi:hypothetical protein J6590_041073 [Homalodisca vitripennis]|nr:hypothetical protein J6590_041073 [Homalodisca vitripennis]
MRDLLIVEIRQCGRQRVIALRQCPVGQDGFQLRSGSCQGVHSSLVVCEEPIQSITTSVTSERLGAVAVNLGDITLVPRCVSINCQGHNSR